MRMLQGKIRGNIHTRLPKVQRFGSVSRCCSHPTEQCPVSPPENPQPRTGGRVLPSHGLQPSSKVSAGCGAAAAEAMSSATSSAGFGVSLPSPAGFTACCSGCTTTASAWAALPRAWISKRGYRAYKALGDAKTPTGSHAHSPEHTTTSCTL